MENGISIFIGIIAALATYAILWLVYLKPKQTKLEAARDMAKQLNASLTAQRDTANEEQAALERKLEQEEQRSAEFDSELEMAEQSNAVLQNRLEQEEQRSTQLDSQLNAEERRSANLQSQLNAEEQHSASLQSQLNAEKQHSARLDSQLNVANRRIRELDGKLNTAEKNITDLQSQLNQTAQSNDNAIQLLYLTTLSLQACAVVLRRERDRYTRLDKNYRNLADAYNDLVGNYEEFRDDIKSKANRRLVKKGVGIALAFVPGLALIDILSDLGDILSVATEADEAIDVLDVDLSDIDKSAASSSEVPEVSEDGMPIEGVSFLPLIPRAQSGVEETLQQNLSIESTTHGPSNLDAFAADILQYMKDLLNSLPPNEQQEAIDNMINNLQEFDYKLIYPSRTDKNSLQRKSK